LTKGKSTIRVGFRPGADATTGAVFDLSGGRATY